MNTQEALKMAIEELNYYFSIHPEDEKLDETLQACKEALAKPAQEPVAWLYKRENSSGGWYVVTNYEKENDNGTRNIECYDIPLYTHSAPSWQGLSSKKLEDIKTKAIMGANGMSVEQLLGLIVSLTEQALKEKNT